MNNKQEIFRSTKIIDGFSTCFRQWKATGTHCSFLHGYSIYFKVTFEGDLDERNWVNDFGFLKRSKTKMKGYGSDEKIKEGFTVDEWFKYFFDHTVVIAEDDPYLETFYKLHTQNALQLRFMPQVGCEMFAKFVYENLNKFIKKETDYRVKVVEVECFEHSKNSAIYSEYNLD